MLIVEDTSGQTGGGVIEGKSWSPGLLEETDPYCLVQPVSTYEVALMKMSLDIEPSVFREYISNSL